MKSCLYCAQINTRKNGFGYCIQYNCFEWSGKKKILDNFIRRASDLWINDKTMSVSGPVSNFYSKNHRAANDLMFDAKKVFGFVPQQLLNRIPSKFYGPWDKNIRW